MHYSTYTDICRKAFKKKCISEIPTQVPRVFRRGHGLGEQRRTRRRRRRASDRRDSRRQDGKLPPLHVRAHLSQRSRQPPPLGRSKVRKKIQRNTGWPISWQTWVGMTLIS